MFGMQVSARSLAVIEGVTVLQANTGNMTLDAAIGSASWQPIAGASLSAGYTRSAWWMRLDLRSESAGKTVLNVLRPVLDDVRFYITQAIAGTLRGELVGTMLMIQQGDRHPPHNRSLHSRAFNVILDWPGAMLDAITNAIVHGVSGEPIKVIGWRKAGCVEIPVKNRGPQISATNRDKLFDRYFLPSEKGHGIGLWACRSIVLAHGGDIRHESISQGSRFVVTSLDLLPEPQITHTLQ